MAQRFLALVLLPRIRNDISDNKRLHFALFQAMRKAAYKPGAFYKVRPAPAARSPGDATAVSPVSAANVSTLRLEQDHLENGGRGGGGGGSRRSFHSGRCCKVLRVTTHL